MIGIFVGVLTHLFADDALGACVLAAFRSAEFSPLGRVARVDYQAGMVFIRWVGDHKAYDKIDAATV